MTRRGFALIATLWLLVAIAAITTSGIGFARETSLAARNRSLLAKAEWAREACIEIGRSRYHAWARGNAVRSTFRTAEDVLQPLTIDSLSIGDLVWCNLHPEDAGSRLDFNRADSAALVCLLGDQGAAEKLLLARPLPSVGALAAAMPIDSSTAFRLADLLTPHGTGQVNLNTAPSQVLGCIPGLGADGASAIVSARRRGRSFGSLDEAIAILPFRLQQRIRARFLDFSRVAVTAPPLLIIVASAWAGKPRLCARSTVVMAADGSKLQIQSREAE